ncbi:MAG: hypothetical protein BJ554DRAFT_7201 [Olpidium bornovanus]|uniref:Transglutaminase-like domain-containing protein n=1 Tax=Olpidium bornovanus TaxID=278681 RepID=A0A8H7ZX91_9FUNG|nr:MAG: hypothetical protein BJ554DRAFT_7201 [Olpidium bornovanus]
MDQQQAVSAVASRLARALASGLPPPSPSAGEQRGASYSPQEPRTCALLLEDAFRGAVPGREGPEFAFLGALCATPQQRSFLGRLRASLLAALQHGERGVQEAALAKLPEELRRRERPAAAEEEEERGEESGGRPAAEGGGGGAGQEEEEDPQLRLAKRLLRWFKGDFFKWVDSPDCRRCPAKGTTRAAGALPPTPIEVIYGAHRVEAHRCSACGGTTRFPRYGYTGKLLETRSGRCGEWANVSPRGDRVFTLIARAVGFEARYVVDWTDHVWTEVRAPGWFSS